MNKINIVWLSLLIIILPSFSYAQTISGHVFEDMSADLLADGDIGLTDITGDQRRLTDVMVRLYKDKGDNVPSANDEFISSQTITNTGEFSFEVSAPGLYYVAVNMPKKNQAGEYKGWVDAAWGSLHYYSKAEQTYAYSNDFNLSMSGAIRPFCNDGNGNVILSDRSNGACYGGKTGDGQDLAPTSNLNLDASKHEHITAVRVLMTDVSEVNFGFSFNVVTNTHDVGQGTFRQFAQNAAISRSSDTMRFVPTVPPNRSGKGLKWWEISFIPNPYQSIGYSANRPVIYPVSHSYEGGLAKQSGIIIDGRAYHFTDGTTRRDTTPGKLKGNIALGADWDSEKSLGFDIPELCLRPEYKMMEFYSANNEVSKFKNLCVLGGGTGNNVVARSNGYLVIENNFFNVDPTGKKYNELGININLEQDGTGESIFRNNYAVNLDITVFSDKSVIIEDNEFYGSRPITAAEPYVTGQAIHLYTVSNGVVRRNLFDHQKGLSMRLKETYNLDLSHNTFANLQESVNYKEGEYNHFIHVLGGYDGHIYFNKFINNSGDGDYSGNAIAFHHNYGRDGIQGMLADKNQFLNIKGMSIDWLPAGPSPTLHSPPFIISAWSPEDLIDCHATDYVVLPERTGYSRPVLSSVVVDTVKNIATVKGQIRCGQGSFRLQLYTNGGEHYLGESDEVVLSSEKSVNEFTTVVKLLSKVPKGARAQALGIRMEVGKVHSFMYANKLAKSNDVSELDGESGVVIRSGCDVSGEVSLTSLAVQGKVGKEDILIIPSNTTSPSAGYLKAYVLDSSGTPSSTALWDASTMSASDRKLKLYTSHSDNKLQLFSSVTHTQLEVKDEDAADIVKAYTFDPSYDSGKYLDGRLSGHFLGILSRGNEVKILSKDYNNHLFLKDPSYRSFANDVIKDRKTQVVFNSSDGFLYNIDYKTGKLLWAWMPKSLLPELKNTSFMKSQFMDGEVKIVDAKDSNGSYATYIVGTYKEGLGHYVIKLTNTGMIQSVIMDVDYSASYRSSPLLGASSFIMDNNKNLYKVFCFLNSENETVVKIQSITDQRIDYTINTNTIVTSKPYISNDHHSRYAPAKYSLYLANNHGDIFISRLLSTTGELLTESKIKTNLATATIDVSTHSLPDDDGVSYLGIVQSSSRFFLRTQSKKRLTVYRYESGEWKPLWTSFRGGAGTWTSSGQYREVNNTVPSLFNGHPLIPSNLAVQALPENIIISDEATIVGGNIVLPAYINDESVCSAYYFLYDIETGHFPNRGFSLPDNTLVSKNIFLGSGEAMRLSIADLIGTDSLIGYGNVDQKEDGSVGSPATFRIQDPLETGLRSWRIVE